MQSPIAQMIFCNTAFFPSLSFIYVKKERLNDNFIAGIRGLGPGLGNEAVELPLARALVPPPPPPPRRYIPRACGSPASTAAPALPPRLESIKRVFSILRGIRYYADLPPLGAQHVVYAAVDYGPCLVLPVALLSL